MRGHSRSSNGPTSNPNPTMREILEKKKQRDMEAQKRGSVKFGVSPNSDAKQARTSNNGVSPYSGENRARASGNAGVSPNTDAKQARTSNNGVSRNSDAKQAREDNNNQDHIVVTIPDDKKEQSAAGPASPVSRSKCNRWFEPVVGGVISLQFSIILGIGLAGYLS